MVTEPIGFISPKIDGVETKYFECLGSGVYDTKNQGDSIHQMAQYVESIEFGFDLNHLYVKVVTEPINLEKINEYDTEFCIFKPNPLNVIINLGSLVNNRINSSLSIRRNGEAINHRGGIEAAFKTFLELKIPLNCFGGTVAEKVHFQVKVYRHQKLIEKWPKEDLIVCEIPGPEFEKIEWKV